MQIIETEYLKPCPFCGGKPILSVMDSHLQNGTVTTEIHCENCHSAGQTTTAFNHSVVVGDEAHKAMVKEIVEAWNCRTEVPENKEQLQDIYSTLLELYCLLEKGWGATQNLVSDYFSGDVKKHRESQGMRLLYYYDNARIFSGIADDYVCRALQVTDQLMNSIA